jgi:hypothetical protein
VTTPNRNRQSLTQARPRSVQCFEVADRTDSHAMEYIGIDSDAL